MLDTVSDVRRVLGPFIYFGDERHGSDVRHVQLVRHGDTINPKNRYPHASIKLFIQFYADQQYYCLLDCLHFLF